MFSKSANVLVRVHTLLVLKKSKFKNELKGCTQTSEHVKAQANHNSLSMCLTVTPFPLIQLPEHQASKHLDNKALWHKYSVTITKVIFKKHPQNT